MQNLIERIKNNPELPLIDITAILVEAILAYIERTTNLNTLIAIANEIKNTTKTPLSKKIKDAIDEINSMYVIEEVLIDILNELTEN